MATPERRLRVDIVTPLGKGGRGGIDRVMDEVRAQLQAAPPTDCEVRFLTSRGQGSLVIAPFFFTAVIARIGRAAFGAGPDVVHLNVSSHGSAIRKLLIARVARAVGAPYVIHLHGSGFRSYWDNSGAYIQRRLYNFFAHASAIIVLGQVWRDYVIEKVPDKRGCVVVLPNASAKAKPASARSPNDTVFLFLGRLGPRKGVPQLVEALATLPRDRAWRAIIAGDGAVEETRRAIEKFGIDDRVSTPGWVGPEQVRALLDGADVLVLPSFEENLPMSVVEGMAHGLAVVATPVGATEDIIVDGETGLLAPPGDVTALGGALRKLLDDAGLRADLGRRARAFHAEFLEPGPYVERLIGIWRAVADGRPDAFETMHVSRYSSRSPNSAPVP
jgi:glycosyltransferase involved in cell wall biosynthesis